MNIKKKKVFFFEVGLENKWNQKWSLNGKFNRSISCFGLMWSGSAVVQKKGQRGWSLGNKALLAFWQWANGAGRVRARRLAIPMRRTAKCSVLRIDLFLVIVRNGRDLASDNYCQDSREISRIIQKKAPVWSLNSLGRRYSVWLIRNLPSPWWRLNLTHESDSP